MRILSLSYNLLLFALLNKGYQLHIQSRHGAFQCLETFLNSLLWGGTQVVNGVSASRQNCRESSYFLRACDLFLIIKIAWVNSFKVSFHLFFLLSCKTKQKTKTTNNDSTPSFLFRCFALDLGFLFHLTLTFISTGFVGFRFISSMGTWCYLPLLDRTEGLTGGQPICDEAPHFGVKNLVCLRTEVPVCGGNK